MVSRGQTIKNMLLLWSELFSILERRHHNSKEAKCVISSIYKYCIKFWLRNLCLHNNNIVNFLSKQAQEHYTMTQRSSENCIVGVGSESGRINQSNACSQDLRVQFDKQHGGFLGRKNCRGGETFPGTLRWTMQTLKIIIRKRTHGKT